MPPIKKKTKPSVKSKKTVAKKKPAVKKAAAPTVAPPVVAPPVVAPPVVAPWSPMKINLYANNGEYTLTFADEASFNRALNVVAERPPSSDCQR